MLCVVSSVLQRPCASRGAAVVSGSNSRISATKRSQWPDTNKADHSDRGIGRRATAGTRPRNSANAAVAGNTSRHHRSQRSTVRSLTSPTSDRSFANSLRVQRPANRLSTTTTAPK